MKPSDTAKLTEQLLADLGLPLKHPGVGWGYRLYTTLPTLNLENILWANK